MHLECTLSLSSIGNTVDWACAQTRNDDDLRIWIFSKKMPFSMGKKMFQRQILEVQYTINIGHLTNSSDFEWF